MKSPAFRFYPSDFWGSPDVQAMDLHEIAAYFSLICNAWLSERPGYLADDDEKLRRWARMTREQWQASRGTLLAKFPVAEPGWRLNPRLSHEAEKQERYSDSQREKINKRWDAVRALNNPDDTGEHTGVSKPDTGVIPSVSVSVSKKDKDLLEEKDAPLLESFCVVWNETRGQLAELKKVTGERRKKLRIRIKDGLTLQHFTEAVQLAARTPFCRGGNDRGWKLDFDWLVENETNLFKVLEGKYGEPDAHRRAAEVPMLSTAERARAQKKGIGA